jgi:hypothetical protein
MVETSLSGSGEGPGWTTAPGYSTVANFPGPITQKSVKWPVSPVSPRGGGSGVDPKRTAFRSPWQNGTAERVVGSVRRELLDHVVVLGEGHLRRLLREYVDYYNAERVRTSIADAPVGRRVEPRPWEHAKVVGLPRVGGLHHRYC